MTFEKRFEESELREYPCALLSKALSQELTCGVREIARPVEYKKGRVEKKKVRELKERRLRICRSYKTPA